jgi:glycosyltransferase involved in cell wall biosynthesis
MQASDNDPQHLTHGSVAVFIPALNPDERLVDLVQSLARLHFGAMVVVNDGSGADCEDVFSRVNAIPGAVVLRHPQNCGQGRAVKTAMRYALENLPGTIGAVTADADGQHAVKDIARMAEAMESGARRPVLGTRSFGEGVPMRSRFGNILTRYVFRFFSGCTIADTQSGLRGIPQEWLAEALLARGDRFEFAIGFLAHFCRIGVPPIEVPIATIYIDGNRSSHFKPLRDSVRIYSFLLRSYVASWAPECIDLAGFAFAYAFVRNIAWAVVAGRLAAIAALAAGRRFAPVSLGIPKDYLLRRVVWFAVTGIVSLAAIWGLTRGGGLNTMAAKILVEFVLYAVSGAMKWI